MKKFNKLWMGIKARKVRKPVKDEMKQEDVVTNADNQHLEAVILPSEIPLFPLPQQHLQEHPVNSLEDNFHTTLTVDTCKVCRLRTDVMKPIGNEDILPVEFISSVDEKISHLVPVQERNEIHKAVLEDVKIQFPSYYDFCVIASDDDYSRANQFKLLVCNAFSLRGCMLYDGFARLGSDIFQAYEEMIEHSTKVFFFITDSFNANNFCRRLQSGTVFNSLMTRAKKVREKCVPIFPDCSYQVPLALSGIAGIKPRDHDMLDQSMHTTYTIRIRQELALKNQENNRNRALKYLELFKERIEYRKREQDALQDRIANLGIGEMDEGEGQQLKIPGSSIESELESTSFVNQTGIVKNCVDHDIETVLQPNLGNTPNELLGRSPENRKRKPETKTDGDSSVISEVVPVLEEIIKAFPSDYPTYNISGNNTRIGHQITINICNQQTCSCIGSSNAHCCGNGENEDDSSIDPNGTDSECSASADSDVDLNESVKLPSRKSAVETDRSSSGSECSNTFSSEMNKVRS
ncbi:uncharacterized protein [Anabrus simplex]|uniref:uncharacterized protein n=1 Tax=Anabrus simplex TaxID=316456 RepID=UPI0034DD98CA